MHACCSSDCGAPGKYRRRAPSTQYSSGLEASIYNALPCNFGFLAQLHLHRPLLENPLPTFQLKIASLAKTQIYTGYTRHIVLTMADTDSDKFPLHTAAREGRGIELFVILTHLSITKLTWPSVCCRRSPQGMLKRPWKINTHKHIRR